MADYLMMILNYCFRVAQQSNEAYNLEEREEFTEIESLLLSGM